MSAHAYSAKKSVYNIDQFSRQQLKQISPTSSDSLGSDAFTYGDRIKSITGIRVVTNPDLEGLVQNQVIHIYAPHNSSNQATESIMMYDAHLKKCPDFTSIFIYGVPKIINLIKNTDNKFDSLIDGLNDLPNKLDSMTDLIRQKTSLNSKILNSIQLCLAIGICIVMITAMIVLQLIRISLFYLWNLILILTLYV